MNLATGLGYYYLLLGLMNAVCAFMLWRRSQHLPGGLVWLGAGIVLVLACASFLLLPGWAYVPILVLSLLATFGLGLALEREELVYLEMGGALASTFLFVILGAVAMGGSPIVLAESVRDAVDNMANPISYSVGTTVALVVLYVWRRLFVQPAVAWVMLNASLLLMGLSITDYDFYRIAAKPDNVPIVAMVFLLGFFTWLATYKAVQNDDRIREGKVPLEKLDDEKILVWPDLVYTEMICMVALTVVLFVWAVALQAPLEEPSSTVKTPNPSKAPWYFLGLQEMLVYYDPWMAGVVLPSLVVFGLMAIPYIDFNKQGNAYYTIEQRKFGYLVFQFGFLEMWVTLIILGTFLRGPNWNFFGPYEEWYVHKVEALNNVNLSEYFWIALNKGYILESSKGLEGISQLLAILWRELPGIILVGLYFVALPPLMATTIFRKFFVKMGFLRFMVMANLLLFMASLPLKMVLRWTINLKYLIAIPEYFLNF